ncbi:MarR family winged helix-turn-helix transcriptional regulator [Evansella halocellulosilytica]|uniref:MarR family winged helix-turn-helix transcriptional regulator n=1 Tax=Evansella halocellulosilytica TaxID=2011013 RepID=UPI000BB99913|nr:MarR family transcriptional regulator [Evansella halocellulosilytica]
MSTDNFSREQQLQKLFYEFRENSTLTIMVHQAIATKLGLNVTDHKCLDIIVKNEPMTAGQLSELTGLSTGAVTGVLNRLEKAGYVFREKDTIDKRKVIIKVNQVKLEEKLPVFDKLIIESRDMLSIYSDEELQFIYEFYKRCNHALHNVLKGE